jgi:hypothetical protein
LTTTTAIATTAPTTKVIAAIHTHVGTPWLDGGVAELEALDEGPTPGQDLAAGGISFWIDAVGALLFCGGSAGGAPHSPQYSRWLGFECPFWQ